MYLYICRIPLSCQSQLKQHCRAYFRYIWVIFPPVGLACGIVSFTLAARFALHIAGVLTAGQARHQGRELKQIRETKKRAILPNDDFRIRAIRIGPLRRNGANRLVIDAQQESLAGSVGSLTDADELSPTERMKWVCYPHKLRQSRRRVCIPV